MRVKNTTDIPNEVVRDAVRFARPSGIKNFRVVVNNSSYSFNGHGGRNGATVRVNTKDKYPQLLKTYQYGQLRGKRYYLASVTEALIYMLAHELMHTRQGQGGRRRGRVWGARGRFSEIETESYAIRKLREWRKAA